MAQSTTITPETTIDEAIEKIGFGKFQIYLLAVFGIVVVGEALEFLVVSFLVPYIVCDWHLNSLQAAILSIFFFFCVLIGSFVWGYAADLYGRKGCLVLLELSLFYFGMLSAASQSFAWFIILRGIVGFCLSGAVLIAYPLFMELVPKSRRNFLHVYHGIFGGLVGVLILLSGSYFLHHFGWRSMLIIAAVPSLLGGSLTFFFIPQSPRFLLINNRKDEAELILTKISKTNGIPNFTCYLRYVSDTNIQASVLSIFANEHLKLAIPMLLISIVVGLVHFGVVLLSIVLPPFYRINCSPNVFHITETNMDDLSCTCSAISAEIFLPVTLGMAGESLSFILPGPLAYLIGRRNVFLTGGLLIIVLLIAHAFCKSLVALSFTLLINRALTLGMFLSVVLYVGEAYPTAARASAVGINLAMTRIGNMIAPLFIQVFLPMHALWQSMLILGIFSLMQLVAVLFLPFETKDRQLHDNFEEYDEASNDRIILDETSRLNIK